MTLIINPGSTVDTAHDQGWTNTLEGARANAERWHQNMIENGFGADIELLPDATDDGEGRWSFTFRHKATGKTATLDTHGIHGETAEAAYAKAHIFGLPRVYWNGSSTGNPDVADWAADGYTITYRPVTPSTAGSDPS